MVNNSDSARKSRVHINMQNDKVKKTSTCSAKKEKHTLKECNELIAKKEAELEILRKEKKELEQDLLGFKTGEKPYMLFINGDIEQVLKPNIDLLEAKIRMGNVFHTRKEAEFERERRKVLAKLRYLSEQSGEKGRAWDSYNLHWGIKIDMEHGGLVVDYRMLIKQHEVYFATEETAKDAIAQIGEDRIKKYYLEVTKCGGKSK